MNAPRYALRYLDWTEANQQFLVAEIAYLKARLSSEDTEACIIALNQAQERLAEPSAIDRLIEYFGLSGFERDILLLCAGVEMDSALAALCAKVQDNTQRQYATFGLAMAALAEPHWSALSPMRPLRRWRLIEIGNDNNLTSSRLKIDERVLHYLAGVNFLDTRLEPLLRPQSVAENMAETHHAIVQKAVKTLRERETLSFLIQLIGDDRDGQLDTAAAIAAGLGLQLYIIRSEDIPAGIHELDALAVLWQRESALLGSALLIECSELNSAAACIKLAERLGGLLFVASQEPLQFRRNASRFTINKPSAPEQRRLWEQALGTAVLKLNGSLDGVATQFRLSAQTILSAGTEVRAEITAGNAPDETLWGACRTFGRRQLDDLAQRVEAISQWEDLILPEAQKEILHQIVAHVRNRLQVCEDWGFAYKSSRGLGLSTLFAGESGTGKTMAAEVLANELHLDLYRIDLSSVVSKYIGETEKNLRRVFDAAEDCGAILLFDEADALFGKRSEVKDSHDRYANIEVSYLLQRMEAYSGLAILTTNMKTALDTAFQRRLRFVVQFPFPDSEQREVIWRSVFPEATPTHELNYRKLAQLQVAGGNIRNIAFNAAFLAADADEPVGMQHLLHAAHGEGAKRERPLSDAETRGWV